MANCRFNPTTNGLLHAGHSYVALLNYHAAKSSGGEFIVRADDDQEWWVRHIGREKMAEYADAAKQDLEWLGIVADRYTSEWHERDENERLMPGLPKLEPYEAVLHEVHETYAYVTDWPHSYPLVSYLTASKVIQDHREGIDLLIRGMDLLTEHNLYGYLCRLLGFPIPTMQYVPRLRRLLTPFSQGALGELSDVSKTAGGYKIADYRAAGWNPESVVAMLAESCLKDPAAGWTFENVKDRPVLLKQP